MTVFCDHITSVSSETTSSELEGSIEEASTHVGPSLQHTVMQVANSLLSQTETEGAIADSRVSGVNLVVGQLNNAFVTETLFSRPTLAVPIHSVLEPSARQKVGLLRAPALQESKLHLFDYNLSMADEALFLALSLREQLKAGGFLSFDSLWTVCREWRVGRLAKNSHPDEIAQFSTPREGREGGLVTPIVMTDDRYSHLLAVIKLKLDKAISAEQRGITFPVLVHCTGLWQRQPVCRVQLQYVLKTQGKLIPLTALRAVFDEDGKPVLHPWLHAKNIACGLNEPIRQEIKKNDLNCGLIYHMPTRRLALLRQALHAQCNTYAAFLKEFEGGNPLSRPLTVPNLNDSHAQNVLKQLASIHYALAHATLDQRGSAAKSELLVRTLAAIAGFELPPFKKGFVPDLNAFVSSQEAYVQSYLKAFEV